jgi:hypothetical protein
MPSTISAGTTAGTAIAVAGDTTGNLAFQTNGTTTAMTIDTSQNVGIGTASPATLEHLSSNTNTQLRIETTATGSVSVTQYKNAAGNVHQIGSETSAGNAGFNGSSAYALCLEAAGARDICFSANSALRAKITSDGLMQFNSGYGSVATAYGCRAWVNFDGEGTPTIRASGNVSSITDGGTGTYTVNFTTAMPDANYSVGYALERNATSAAGYRITSCVHTLTTGGFSVGVVQGNTASFYDDPTVCFQVFR